MSASTGRWRAADLEGAGPMPSLMRFLTVLGAIGAVVYGALYLLANLVEPEPREIVETLPQQKATQPPTAQQP
jgi:hypothetical protein